MVTLPASLPPKGSPPPRSRRVPAADLLVAFLMGLSWAAVLLLLEWTGP